MPISIQKNINLKNFTTFKIGGIAEYFLKIKTKEDLIFALQWAKENKKEIKILAGGSNVLIPDEEISGLVIKLENNKIALKGERIECEAGANLMSISRLASSHGLSGLEWAVGVPGTIGGAIRGNAGAYGAYIEENIETIEIFNIKKNEFIYYSPKDCDFSYKESIFKKNKNLIIWQATLKLAKGDLAEIKQKIENYINQRNLSQPKLPSAGCIFKNLELNKIEKTNPELAKYILEKKINIKNNKIGAGYIIDLLGLKGKAMGGAKVSLEHGNFIVNTGNATANQVSMLIRYLKKAIKERFKIELEEEIQYLETIF